VARFKDDEDEHDSIVEALKNRDPDGAEEAMRHHIRTSADTLFATVQTDSA
jgi:DNA-binding GntR family transcriptional regulator